MCGGGIKCPIIFSNDTRIKGLTKENVVVEKMKFGTIFIGFDGSEGINKNKTNIIISNGKIIFKGRADISTGTSVRVDVGNLIIGDGFSCNRNCFISCSKGITIGDDVLMGWDINIRDSDGHTIYKNDVKRASHKAVTIGNHVWIASYVDILKGVNIPNGCVVGYRSCVTNSFTNENTLIAGYPARMIQENIKWDH